MLTRKPYHNVARQSPLIFSIFLHQISCRRVQSILRQPQQNPRLAPTMPCISLVINKRHVGGEVPLSLPYAHTHSLYRQYRASEWRRARNAIRSIHAACVFERFRRYWRYELIEAAQGLAISIDAAEVLHRPTSLRGPGPSPSLRCSTTSLLAAASSFAKSRASLPWYKNTRRTRINRLWSP